MPVVIPAEHIIECRLTGGKGKRGTAAANNLGFEIWDLGLLRRDDNPDGVGNPSSLAASS